MIRAPYMEWAKTRPRPAWDLAGSNLLHCSLEDLPGAADALVLGGRNDEGYPPLVAAIAARYGVEERQVATATGTSGANFLACAALLEPGDEVLVERPGYDPLLAAPGLVGARLARFDRRFEDGYRLDPDRVAAAMTPATRLIVVTNLHNPSGVLAAAGDLLAVGRIAARAGAHGLVGDVYLDAAFDGPPPPAARLGDRFVSTSSLTKSYGLAGLRCGWAIASAEVAERIRRARDIVDGTGSVPAEALSVLAFEHLDRLALRARSILLPNLAVLAEVLDARPGLVEYVRPAGGTVVFPRLRGVADTSAFAGRLSRNYATAVVPGRFFESPSHVRISYGGRPDVVASGAHALARALDSDGSG
jgi:aspartate/methionine/tyrosine aminotransferase